MQYSPSTMELPRDPTILPPARRYSRTFAGEQGRSFREKDEISINIPRINNTYLAKDVKLHFDFQLTYREASAAKLTEIYADLRDDKTTTEAVIFANNYFGLANQYSTGDEDSITIPNNSTFAYTKPIPTFDINGPYGLIERIQVFSYLNNTLLEDIQGHNLLTAQFADFWFKTTNIDISRPRVSATLINGDQETVVRKQPCANIIDPHSTLLLSPMAVTVDTVDKEVTPTDLTVNLHCQLDLFSFLGRFSDKFVPLHNGFRVVITLAKTSECVSFNTPFGGNQVIYQRYGFGNTITTNEKVTTVELDDDNNTLVIQSDWSPTPFIFQVLDVSTITTAELLADALNLLFSGTDFTVSYNDDTDYENFTFSSSKPFVILGTSTMLSVLGIKDELTTYSVSDTSLYGVTELDSSIVDATVSNMYLQSTLLEVPPEVDAQVDKMVYARAWKYQQNHFTGFGSDEISTDKRNTVIHRVIPELRSVTKVFVGQRVRSHLLSVSKQKLGFRIRNYTAGGKLLFNKAEVCVINGDSEAWTALEDSVKPRFDSYLNFKDFVVDEPSATGTNGEQMILPSDALVKSVVDYATGVGSPTAGWFPTSAVNHNTVVPSFTFLSNADQGRYLLAFNTRIPGAMENAVAGIDTVRSLLEYQLIPDDDVCWNVLIDVFVEHDSFIHVDPGKSTSVTF